MNGDAETTEMTEPAETEAEAGDTEMEEGEAEAGEAEMTEDETESDAAETTETESETDAGAAGLDAWLQEVNSGERQTGEIGETLDWGHGYLLYYGAMDSLGIDNLIYNGLTVHSQLEQGDVSEADLSQSQQNLLTLTEGVEFDPETELTEQVAQTPEIRAGIMEHVVDSQQDLSPAEALDSDNIVGVIAPPAPESMGTKYLVYGHDSPDAEFNFLGVVIASDATNQDTREPYSVGEWQGLTWLGDAAGPYWEDIPAGVSGDPSSTDEGRPGVLLISEDAYQQIEGEGSE